MAEFPFKKIDAFATPTSAGNPAGAIYLESMEAIRENQMQRIARELGGFVSETGFIARIAADAFKVRYFSAEREVQFCGHATIAMLFDLFAHDAALAEVPRIRLHTNKGILTVENRVREEAAVHIQAPAPVYTAPLPPPAEIARALKLPESALDPAGLGLVNAGNQTLCVRSIEAIEHLVGH